MKNIRIDSLPCWDVGTDKFMQFVIGQHIMGEKFDARNPAKGRRDFTVFIFKKNDGTIAWRGPGQTAPKGRILGTAAIVCRAETSRPCDIIPVLVIFDQEGMYEGLTVDGESRDPNQYSMPRIEWEPSQMYLSVNNTAQFTHPSSQP